VPGTLTVSGGTLGGPQNLVAGNLDWSGGTITNTGIWFGGGGFSSGSLYLDGGMLTNSGVLYWTNNATLYDGNGSVFTNLPGATIIVSNVYSGGSWLYGGDFPGSHVFGNGGTITVDATGTVMVYTENFVNAGTITINSGMLDFSEGTLMDSGPVKVAVGVPGGATLELGGADTFTAATSISGYGNLLVDRGTVAVNGTLGLSSDTWTFGGGTTTITGPDSVGFNLITVSGGTVNFNGSGIIAPICANGERGGAGRPAKSLGGEPGLERRDDYEHGNMVRRRWIQQRQSLFERGHVDQRWHALLDEQCHAV